MWLLVVDELFKALENRGVTIIGYADDVVLTAGGKFPDTYMLQSALRVGSLWTKTNGLGINATVFRLSILGLSSQIVPSTLGNF